MSELSLRERRRKLKILQHSFAEQLGCSIETVKNIENGLNSRFRHGYIQILEKCERGDVSLPPPRRRKFQKIEHPLPPKTALDLNKLRADVGMSYSDCARLLRLDRSTVWCKLNGKSRMSIEEGLVIAREVKERGGWKVKS